LRRMGPDGAVDRLTLDLAPGAMLQAVVDALGIVLKDDAVLLVVNNRIAGAETPLADGDEVRLIPAMSGGD
ncbi:MAG: MoaD/ThiS family protein, partial [Chloroflexi bacterium]|nr:MoaD/ThiS family protein [Chloroflexota bacterium]